MKEVLALIEQKKQEFAQLPLFEFMQDKSIDPRQRLAFAPCLAPFALSFGDLNKYVFREEPTSDPIQAIINKHTYEDDHHWVWFLGDLRKLGLDQSMNFSNSLRFLWGQETKAARWLVHELYRYTFQATPIQKLVVIEVIEATGNVFSSASTTVARELQKVTQKKYLYFGDFHLSAELGHISGLKEGNQFLEDIQLRKETRKKAFELVEKVFELFTELINELLVYAKTHNISQSFVTTSQIASNTKPLGAYLMEAGLLNRDQLKVALNKQKETPMRLGQVLSSLGWVSQETIEYMMDKVVVPQRKGLPPQTPQPMDLVRILK